MILRGATVSDGGPYACPECGGQLRPDVYLDQRIDYWCAGCARVIVISAPGWPRPVLQPFQPGPPGGD